MKKKNMEWWHSHRIEDPYAMLVLMFLALNADAAGHGKTTRKRLAADANLPVGKLIDCLIDLEIQKLVTADIDERGRINYELNLKKKGGRAK